MQLSAKQLLEIMQRTLNYIDPRLVEHGKHVAILIHDILKQTGPLDEFTRSKLYLLGLLHDVGAYKTEEITHLLNFDASGSWAHCVYGYLFLKELSPMGEDALPILYHHLPYHSYGAVEPPLDPRDFAGLIFLADRVAVVLNETAPDFCRQWVLQHRGTLFSPYWVDLFLQGDGQRSILTQLKHNGCPSDWAALTKEFHLSWDALPQYLSLIAYAIDFRSEHMVVHTINTVSISDVIGKNLELDGDTLEDLHYGALLHDIGKVACPVEILEKPDRLTPDEMEIMKRHVVITREILNGLIDPVVLEIACRHHERLDGSGYPQGLTQDELDLPQRIVAVADVVSALIRRRSYKTAYDKKTTLKILFDIKAKNQFCCSSVDYVLEHFDEIIQVSDLHAQRMMDAYEGLNQEYHALIAALSAISMGNTGV